MAGLVGTLVSEQLMDVEGARIAWQGFGSAQDPLVLLIAGMGQSMTWWDAELCERLAAEGRYVVRYDHRDTGRSSSSPAGAPAYTGRDLDTDPLRLLDGLGVGSAHVVGFSMGGGIAQTLAVGSPERVRTLTLVDTSPAAPGGPTDLPGPAARLRAAYADPEPEPDWSDRSAVIDYRVAIERPYAGAGGLDEERYRRLAAEEVQRTTDMAAALRNHELVVGDWPHDRGLEAVVAPTLVVHGTSDPAFPLAHGEALRDCIRGARLVVLDGGGHQQPPPSTWDLFVRELVRHTA